MQLLYKCLLGFIGATTLLAVVGGWASSASWVGTTFPGFLVLENRVVASAGLQRWPATRDGAIYQREVISIDGSRIASVESIQRAVSHYRDEASIEYGLHDGATESTVEISPRTFEWIDFSLLFAPYLLGGGGMCCVAFLIAWLRNGDRRTLRLSAPMWVIGMWALTATDLYGPYRLFRVHAFLECLLLPAALQFALCFPYERRIVRPPSRLLRSFWMLGCVLGLSQQAGLYDPASYRLTHGIAIGGFGIGLAGILASQLDVYLRPRSFEDRQRVKVLGMSLLIAILPAALLALHGAMSGGTTPQNMIGWSGLILPVAIGYAVLVSDVFEIDVMLRRTVNYVVVAVLLGGAYATTLAVIDHLSFISTGSRTAAVLVFAVTAAAILLPLRDRLQGYLDQLFFRSAYDARIALEGASVALSSVTDLDRLLETTSRIVEEAVHPEWLVIEYRGETDGESRVYPDTARFGPMGLPSSSTMECAVTPIGNGSLAVPIVVEGRCSAMLLVGRPRSGAFYSGEDHRFLQTLANLAATAFENAIAIRALRQLNHDLETIVDERTAELGDALQHLTTTQGQLVQQEKMASLGQLVAGIAHEINNPLNFIAGNVDVLREHADELIGAIDAYRGFAEQGEVPVPRHLDEKFDIPFVVADLGELFDACHEGLSRATAIVGDLRSFSRLDRGAIVDLCLDDAIATTLNLLRGRTEGIEFVRSLVPGLTIECSAGQINQVLMNLVANAIDAVEGVPDARIEIHGSQEEATVVLVIADNGCGMAPDDAAQMFDPFFTTKPVGKGTGLGLSITHGIVEEHEGSISAESSLGEGTRIRLELPSKAAASLLPNEEIEDPDQASAE